METQQALLRHTIDLNTKLIAQANRLISNSRSGLTETDEKQETPPLTVPSAGN